jgi:hypothetical protein
MFLQCDEKASAPRRNDSRVAKGRAAGPVHTHGAAKPNETRLTRQRARRRRRRRMPPIRYREIDDCEFERPERRQQADHAGDADHVDLGRGRLTIRFLLRILSRVDGMTKRTGMSAIERLRNRLTQRRALRVLNDHGRPGHGLQSEPMQTDCATQSENRSGAAQAAKHDFRLLMGPRDVNKLVGQYKRGRCTSTPR